MTSSWGPRFFLTYPTPQFKRLSSKPVVGGRCILLRSLTNRSPVLVPKCPKESPMETLHAKFGAPTITYDYRLGCKVGLLKSDLASYIL